MKLQKKKEATLPTKYKSDVYECAGVIIKIEIYFTHHPVLYS